MIIRFGVPIFFITFARTEFKHPICLYFCGEKVDLLSSVSQLPDFQRRMRLIAEKPVACARFFHLMVTLFITHVLRLDDADGGLFGPVQAYYGTVEEQERLSLHLHMLLWIMCSLSPEQIRARTLDDPAFRESLLDWLEQCHRGDFCTGTLSDVRDRQDNKRRERTTSAHVTQLEELDPVLQLPTRPPAFTTENSREQVDEDLRRWLTSVHIVSDEVVCRSNQHSQTHSKG